MSLPAFVRVFTHVESAIFAALLVVWLADIDETAKFVLGLTHGVGFLSLCAVIWVAWWPACVAHWRGRSWPPPRCSPRSGARSPSSGRGGAAATATPPRAARRCEHPCGRSICRTRSPSRASASCRWSKAGAQTVK